MKMKPTGNQNGITSAIVKLLTRSGRRWRKRQLESRRRRFEQLERRELMALNILSVSPLDGSTNVPLNSDLVIQFNEPVVKGQGNIYVVRQSLNSLGVAVDVRSSNVAITGSEVRIDLPVDLELDNTYTVYVDSGAFLDTSTGQTAGATLLRQDFDFLPLKPQVFETSGNGINDWTDVPPLGFVRDNSAMVPGTGQVAGVPEWDGWTFARKEFWFNADNQARDQFALGSNVIAVADADEFDDATGTQPDFNAKLLTKPIDLTGVAANTVKFEFDSSFRPEDSQVGTLEVSYDGGTNWSNLLTLNPSNTTNTAGNPATGFVNKSINERLVSGTNTGVSTDGLGNAPFAAISNPDSGTMVFRYTVTGRNDWWWAIDNLLVTGTVNGVPFGGVSDPLYWNFATPESPRLTLSIDRASMSENGGTATATLSRNNLPTGDLVVTLASSDTTEATVPASVTIPDGQSSVTFTITAVDDLLSDRAQTAVITATASGWATATGSIVVLDDEGPKIVSLTPPDNATAVDYKSNFEVVFDTNIVKGNGNIRIIDAATGFAFETIDVRSSNVAISGSTMTIDPTRNLFGLTDYYILMDDGIVLDSSVDLTPNITFLSESFDYVPLLPFPSGVLGGDGTDYSLQPPAGYAVDNTLMPAGDSPFRGWSFMGKNSWVGQQGDQSRSRFTRGSGTVVVADADAWDDFPHNTGAFNSFFVTPGLDLTGITPGSVHLEFDSSYYPELPQFGTVEVSYDNGATWGPLLFFGDASNTNDGRNDRIVINSTNTLGQYIGGATVDAPLNTPATGILKFKFGLQNAGDNWWWTIDNLKIWGERAGVPFSGIGDPAAWSFRTAEAPTLTITVNPGSISENGGIATGTVTRNLSTIGDLVVTLVSSDVGEAIVPATVTIPDGQASATFSITGVDDTIVDGTQVVTIDASVVDFFSVPAQINVLDDDFPKIVSVTPADNSTGVAVGANLDVLFDQPIKKGNGFIYLVHASDNKARIAIDVNSSQVSVSGNTLTIDPSVNLQGLTDYYVRIDRGAILSVLANTTPGVPLLSQDFELLPLGPAVFETVGLTPDGKDWTATPPSGWSVDNSQMPFGGVPEWRGWTMAAKSFWATQGGQSRANFGRGTNTIAVGDTDEWDDTFTSPNNQFSSKMSTNPMNLASVAPNSVRIEFDSSFRPESGGTFVPHVPTNMQGMLDVSYDNGATWTNLLTLDSSNTLGTATAPNVNERRGVDVPNPDDGQMVFRWGLTGTNDWWWAIDNLVITGTVDALVFPGVTDTTTWNFSTAEAPALLVTTSPTTVAENVGVVTGTVTRTLGSTGALLVNLSSSNNSVATVPATVTIPDGQASVDFSITVVDDSYFDSTQSVAISASSGGYVTGNLALTVTDDETGSVMITEIMYDPAGSEPLTEWIELYNGGTTTADLSGWVLDDEDTSNWSAFAAGTLLAPGEVFVAYNAAFGNNPEANLRTQFQVPAVAKMAGLFWGSLDNSPTLSNEILTLRNAVFVSLDEVNFAEDGTVWPAYVNGSSIYLRDVSTDNNVGANWRSSVVGRDGAVQATGAIYNAADKGSPGYIVINTRPVIAVNNAAVVVQEGPDGTNSGTWSDIDGDLVDLSASVGSVTRNGDGTWTWSASAADQQAVQTVVITANDGKRGVVTTSFTYEVTNKAPGLTVSSGSVVGPALSTLTNSGTWTDVAADTVTLSASLGEVVRNGDGTWTWSLATTGAVPTQNVTITATDEDGGSSSVSFSIAALVTVTNRKVFYNGSGFESTGGVDGALDTGKQLLKASTATQTTSFANVINYSRGINGIVLDVAGLAASSLTVDDFTFRMSAQGASGTQNPSSWVSAPAPTAIDVTATAGQPSRVRLEWADGVIINRWLQIIVKANANTGLIERDVYYLGHALGEVNGVAPYRLTSADLSGVQGSISTAIVSITDMRDVNKDRRITSADLSFLQSRVSNSVLIGNITIPASGDGGEGEGGLGTFGMDLGSGLPEGPGAIGSDPARPVGIGVRDTGVIHGVRREAATTPIAMLAMQGESEWEGDANTSGDAPADGSYESLADYLFSNLGRQRRSFWDFGM